MNFTTRLTAVILLFLLCTCKGDNMGGDEISLGERLELASQYSNEHEGDAFLVMKDGELIHEEYQNGYPATQLHILASGSKSFSCAIAVSAISDGVLTLEEKVADTITEWATDPVKSTITYRQLLSLTSGLPSGDSPLYGGSPISETSTADAINADLIFEPGTDFMYGQTNYQVFTEAIYRKLDEDPAEYLRRKVLEPIGLSSLAWARDKNNLPYLAGGAFGIAREWIKYGELILNNGTWNGTQVLDSEILSECFEPEQINGAYGLTFWLNADALVYLYRESGINLPFPDKKYEIPMAAGAFNQRIYLIKEMNMVALRLGRQDNSWSDAEFLSLLVDGEEYSAPGFKLMQFLKKAGN